VESDTFKPPRRPSIYTSRKILRTTHDLQPSLRIFTSGHSSNTPNHHLPLACSHRLPRGANPNRLARIQTPLPMQRRSTRCTSSAVARLVNLIFTSIKAFARRTRTLGSADPCTCSAPTRRAAASRPPHESQPSLLSGRHGCMFGLLLRGTHTRVCTAVSELCRSSAHQVSPYLPRTCGIESSTSLLEIGS
jgi:hypothetical protein